MPRQFRCPNCNVITGEMAKGKVRKGAVLVCSVCWNKASTAIGTAKMASEQSEDFLNFDEKDNPFTNLLRMLHGLKG